LILNCKKCGGRVFVDTTYTGESTFEVYCILCGHRKSVHRLRNPFGRWLDDMNLGL